MEIAWQLSLFYSSQNDQLLHLAFEHSADCWSSLGHQQMFSLSSIQWHFLSWPSHRKCHVSIESDYVQIRYHSIVSVERERGIVLNGSQSVCRSVFKGFDISPLFAKIHLWKNASVMFLKNVHFLFKKNCSSINCNSVRSRGHQVSRYEVSCPNKNNKSFRHSHLCEWVSNHLINYT